MMEPDGAALEKRDGDAAVEQRPEFGRGQQLVDLGRTTRSGPPAIIRSLMRNRMAAVGIVILVLVAIAAIGAPVISSQDPRRGVILESKQPPVWSSGGSTKHLLGTDALGRDIFTRVLYGARISLTVGIVAVLIAGVIGVVVGLISGYYGGFVDDVLMRIADIQLAVPFILFAIAILAVLGQGLDKIIITLGITGWVTYGRVVRGQVLAWKKTEFVEAARCIGARDGSIMLKHILPNVFASIIVLASFAVASTILAEASLSFLGLGVPPDVPTWGGMVASGREYIISGQYWMYTFPGIAIMLAVFGINVVGDWLRDYLDPRLKNL